MLIDVIIILVLVYCVLSGYRKGLIMSLLGLVVLVASCVGAGYAQSAFTDTAAQALEPKLVEIIQPKLSEQLTADTQSALDSAGQTGITVGDTSMTLEDLMALLEKLGLDVEESVTEETTQALEPAVEAATVSIARALSQQLAGALIFIAAFLAIYLVLQSLVLVFDVVDRLPVIHGINHIGGGILGLVEALLVLLAAAAVLTRAGLLPQETGALTQALVRLAQGVLNSGS